MSHATIEALQGALGRSRGTLPWLDFCFCCFYLSPTSSGTLICLCGKAGDGTRMVQVHLPVSPPTARHLAEEKRVPSKQLLWSASLHGFSCVLLYLASCNLAASSVGCQDLWAAPQRPFAVGLSGWSIQAGTPMFQAASSNAAALFCSL